MTIPGTARTPGIVRDRAPLPRELRISLVRSGMLWH
jgi:hypothetical protein